ncbi:MAG: hypothetical protein L6R45_04505 [Anaerolineae bacterium]|nr:hypothetical protein [Anaerolineae bacterium]
MIAKPLSKATTTELTEPITGEALFKLGDIGSTELIKGEFVRNSMAEMKRFSVGDVLADEKVLLGFSVFIAELFAPE